MKVQTIQTTKTNNKNTLRDLTAFYQAGFVDMGASSTVTQYKTRDVIITDQPLKNTESGEYARLRVIINKHPRIQ